MEAGIKGLRWKLSEGSNRAIPVCPDHQEQEATVEDDGLEKGVKGPPEGGVIVTCPKCGRILRMCTKAEFETERESISKFRK